MTLKGRQRRLGFRGTGHRTLLCAALAALVPAALSPSSAASAGRGGLRGFAVPNSWSSATNPRAPHGLASQLHFGTVQKPACSSKKVPLWCAEPAEAIDLAAQSAGEAGKDAGAPVMGSSLNLAKNLVGSGMLSLPAGVAAFAGSPAGLGPALAMVVAAGLLNAYSFVMIGSICEETKTTTFGSAWDKTVRRGAWIPQLVCILECLGGSIIYAMVLGDVFSTSLQALPVLPALATTRTSVIVLLAAVVLYPLCCLRSFAQLAKFSLIGTVATTYVVIFVTLRFLDGSYGPGGAFHNAAAAAPLLGGSILNTRILYLASILATAFLMHFNAPQMYGELRPSRPAKNEEEKAAKQRDFSIVALIGFGLAGVQYALVMVFGFLTFGKAAEGNLLLNYSSADPLAGAARIALGLSMLCGYPMQFAGLRSGLLELFSVERLEKGKHRLVTAALLGGAIFVACLCGDLDQFQAIEGALLASFLSYMAPPIMGLRLWKGRWARLRSWSMIFVGLAATVLGGYVSLRPL